MSDNRPFFRNYRPGTSGSSYIRDPRYAKNAYQYIRSAELIYKDFELLLDYIEPSDQNLNCYSVRIFELFFRVCSEVEANLKAILKENNYIRYKNDKKTKEKIIATDWTMRDYRKVNKSHHLDSYIVILPNWTGISSERQPFKVWDTQKITLPWYQAYNTVKHNRHENFHLATFENLIDSLASLAILLSAQFYDCDFKIDRYCSYGYINQESPEISIGIPFIIKYPNNWTEAEKYSFDWNTLKTSNTPFRSLF